MGGGAVSSVNTGEFSNAIELNAIQRSNPEMQKRVANVIRAMAENPDNPIISIHDHGAGGHLNCLSELVEETGDKLPIGDPTLSAKEIVGNESQERMGLVIKEKDVAMLQRISDRERAPFYVVGETTGDMQFKFENSLTGEKPIDWSLHHLTEAARSLKILSEQTAAQCRIAKGFRNLIHPGRAARLAQKCSLGTALSALAAVEHVVGDLS